MTPRAYSSAARDEAAQKTRGRILAAAIKHLRAKGAGGFSLDAVAQKAKVTRLTVYNQFGSRRELLEAVFDDYALRGGLMRLGEAMGAPQPRAGLTRLVEIFCDFWSFDHGAFANLVAMSTGTEFETAVRARNERRRVMIVTLLDRMAKQDEIAAVSAATLADQVFAITSFAFFAELARGRSLPHAREQVLALADMAVTRAMQDTDDVPASRKRGTGLEPAGKSTRKPS
jgi:AcrR family transcriptional regulator